MSNEYFHVRINSTKENPNRDFNIFMTEMITNRTAIWDKDKGNKIKTGDYLGFITGPNGKEIVYIFRVKNELPTHMRPRHWESAMPYTDPRAGSVSDRGVIELTNDHSLPKTCEWSEIRRTTGLGNSYPSWMPRGTSRVVKKSLLPFAELIN